MASRLHWVACLVRQQTPCDSVDVDSDRKTTWQQDCCLINDGLMNAEYNDNMGREKTHKNAKKIISLKWNTAL